MFCLLFSGFFFFPPPYNFLTSPSSLFFSRTHKKAHTREIKREGERERKKRGFLLENLGKKEALPLGTNERGKPAWATE